MNFIAATVVLKSTSPDPVTAYGLSYRSADAVVPGGNGNSEVRLRLLCYDRAGAKLDAFNNWKEGNRALITGNLVDLEYERKCQQDLVNKGIVTNYGIDIDMSFIEAEHKKIQNSLASRLDQVEEDMAKELDDGTAEG